MDLVWTRRYAFQSVHSLSSGARQERLHGHAYFVELSFTGREIDGADAAMAPVLRELHGRELRFLRHSTGECLVDWIHERLLSTPFAPRLRAVALQETRKNRFVSARSERRYV